MTRRLFFRIHHTQLLNTSDCIMVTLPLDKFIEVACFPSHNLTQCVAGKPCALSSSSSSSSLGWFLRYFLMIIIAKNGGYFTCLCASLSLSVSRSQSQFLSIFHSLTAISNLEEEEEGVASQTIIRPAKTHLLIALTVPLAHI